MIQPGPKVKPNLLGMIVVVIASLLVTAYLGVYISSQDLWWFRKGFDERPTRVVVYNQGQQTEYVAGEPGFDELAEGVRSSLDQGVRRLSGIGLSQASQQDAYGKYLSVEAFFDHPVKLHTYFNTSKPVQMLFPITGRHADLTVVFLGDRNRYWVNVPALNTTDPLKAALKTLGYELEQ